MTKRVEVNLDKPGCLIYRDGNTELTFPCYEKDGDTIVLDTPSRQRVHLFFGWYVVPSVLSLDEKEGIRLRLGEYFRSKNKAVRFLEKPKKGQASILFHPELFELSSTAAKLLDDRGFVWLNDYSAIDVLHDDYGLEISGIGDQRKAESIAEVMARGFPHWHYRRACFITSGVERGWRFSIHMFPKNCRGGHCSDPG